MGCRHRTVGPGTLVCLSAGCKLILSAQTRGVKPLAHSCCLLTLIAAISYTLLIPFMRPAFTEDLCIKH
jgi:hypothetical protein